MVNILCGGPGPHVPADGILGTSNIVVTGMRCSAAVCQAAPDPRQVNHETLSARAITAITANDAFLALASPTNAQTLTQVQRLTRECSGLIRLVLGALDSTDGT